MWALKIAPHAGLVAAVCGAAPGAGARVAAAVADEGLLVLACGEAAKPGASPADEVAACGRAVVRMQVTGDVAAAALAAASGSSSGGGGGGGSGGLLVAGEPLLLALDRLGLLRGSFPLHDPPALQRLRARAMRSAFLPAAAFRSYFGDAIGFYCAFANAVLAWLLAPAALSAWHALAARRGAQAGGGEAAAADDPWVPIVSVFCVLWAGLGLKLWARQEAWGVAPTGAEAREELAPSFRGYPRRSPVTGALELHYPALRRAGRVALSAVAAAAALAAGAALLASLLNLQGSVEARHWWLYIPSLAALREPGGLFAPERAAPLAFAPLAARVVATWAYTSLVYAPLAQRLTAFENHRTAASRTSSLQAKRYALQALFDFAPYLYLALFTSGGLPAASRDLGNFYPAEAARRAAADWLLPLARRRRAAAPAALAAAPAAAAAVAAGRGAGAGGGGEGGGDAPPRGGARRRAGRGKPRDQQELQEEGGREGRGAAPPGKEAAKEAAPPPRPPWAGAPSGSGGGSGSSEGGAGAAPAGGRGGRLLARAAADAAAPPLPDGGSMFEDAAALVRDTGFAVVFASAFPLGPLLCAALTALRLRLDAVKLLGGCRRPPPRRAGGVGRSWRAVIACQIVVAVLSNSLMAGLGSRQLAGLLPAGVQDAATQVALSAAAPEKLIDAPPAGPVAAVCGGGGCGRAPALPLPAPPLSGGVPVGGAFGVPPSAAAAMAAAGAAAAAAGAGAPGGAASAPGGGPPPLGGDAFVAAVSGAAAAAAGGGGGPLVLARPGPLLLVVLLEHGLLLALALIHLCIPEEPEAVRAAAARLQLEGRHARAAAAAAAAVIAGGGGGSSGSPRAGGRRRPPPPGTAREAQSLGSAAAAAAGESE
ncbi:MAG: calcium-activated chloride channel-domain-containing protein [Monoraphidium minutum]|nr:MAG: calcium-activated chloride channel-domain-containing protein [Monoraphidium minutum]